MSYRSAYCLLETVEPDKEHILISCLLLHYSHFYPYSQAIKVNRDRGACLAKWIRLWLESYVHISEEENQMLPLIPNTVPLHTRRETGVSLVIEWAN